MNFRGALRLFRFRGIDVFVHWTWLLLAAYEMQYRHSRYQTKIWNLIELLTVFAIVLMHEFGHALATRSVGGKADKILLWPLGGIAFVQPPQRPGATLWAIAAGPLVNVVLIPVTYAIYLLARRFNLPPDVMEYVRSVVYINLGLLIFNILPFYPLDGGQILRSLLWFVIGPVSSLRVASIIGFCAIGLGVVLITLAGGSLLLYLLAAFAAMQCYIGLKQARILEEHPEILNPEQGPIRRPQLRCPACGQAAPVGNFWRCTCGQPFDTFATGGVCPRCGTQHHITSCPDCRQPSPLAAWYGQPSFPVVFAPPPVFNSVETPPRNPDTPL